MDTYGFDKSDDPTVYLGKIERILTYAVSVAFGGSRSGLVNHLKIPGCESKDDLPRVCKIGDKMKVKIDRVDPKRDQYKLDCIEFPVEDDPNNG